MQKYKHNNNEKKSDFTKLFNLAIDKIADANLLGVYAILLRFSFGKGYCFPSQEKISKEHNISLNTLRRRIKKLEEKGFLTRKKRGQGKTDIYYFEDLSHQDTQKQDVQRNKYPDTKYSKYQDTQKSELLETQNITVLETQILSTNKNKINKIKRKNNKKKEKKESEAYTSHQFCNSSKNILTKEKEKTINSVVIREIIEYLNEKAERKYRSENKQTISLIQARLNEKYTLQDFQNVIDYKSDEWKDNPKMTLYLRPKTLFGNNFEGYLNASQFQKSNQDQKKNEVSLFAGASEDVSF